MSKEDEYEHVHPTVLAQATRETLARLELEEHTVKMQALVAGDAEATLNSGETIPEALKRIGDAKAKITKTYAHLLELGEDA